MISVGQPSPRAVKVKDLGTSIRPELRIDGQSCELYELGERSLTAFSPPNPAFSSEGGRFGWQICVGDHSVCSGDAELASVSPSRNGLRLVLDLAAGTLDLVNMTRLVRQSDYRAQLASGVAGSDALVPAEYKAFCAEVGSALRAYRRLADQIDRDAGGDLQGFQGSLAVFEECANHLVADWAEFGERGSRLCAPLMSDPAVLSALRAFTFRIVTSELLPGAVWRRAYEKPRGYPGDYGVMNYIYAWREVGDTTYERLCHWLGLEFAACVKTRKDVVKDVLRERIEKGEAFSSTSIACGSGQEIFELAQVAQLRAPFTATLMDQDSEALDFAISRLVAPLSRHDGLFRVEARPARFGDFTEKGGAVPPDQDLIYCFGMFDYLPDDTVARITTALYEKLKPGGSLILGNMMAHSPKIWGVCLVLGYDMWFRNEREMMSLAAQCPGARAELRLESTGQNYLLFIRKP